MVIRESSRQEALTISNNLADLHSALQPVLTRFPNPEAHPPPPPSAHPSSPQQQVSLFIYFT